MLLVPALNKEFTVADFLLVRIRRHGNSSFASTCPTSDADVPATLRRNRGATAEHMPGVGCCQRAAGAGHNSIERLEEQRRQTGWQAVCALRRTSKSLRRRPDH